MTPEIQSLIDQTQQNVPFPFRHPGFCAYFTLAALLICATGVVLIFWKLCQIREQLLWNAATQPAPSPRKLGESDVESKPSTATPKPPPDDSRYWPKR
jgi:hypothetical protein